MSISSSRSLCDFIMMTNSSSKLFHQRHCCLDGRDKDTSLKGKLGDEDEEERTFLRMVWCWHHNLDINEKKWQSQAFWLHGNQKWRESFFSCPSSSTPTYGTELFTHSPFIIQSDRRGDARTSGHQTPYTSSFEVIWDNLWLACVHSSTSLQMVIMVEMAIMVKMVIMV